MTPRPVKPIDREAVLRLLDFDDRTGLFTWKARPGNPAFNGRFAGKIAGTDFPNGDGNVYTMIMVLGRTYLAHRLAWTIANGPIPEGFIIDHDDGDGRNNRLANLRLATSSANMRNQKLGANNTSGYNGVSLITGKYRAAAFENGRTVVLGSFASAQDAARVRQAYDLGNGYHPNHGQTRSVA